MQHRQLDDFIQRFEMATLEIGRSIGHCAATAGGEMTGPQQHVMRLLVHAGGMKSSELADVLGIQPSAVTAAVDRLETRGLVTRERADADRRVVRIVPTDEGTTAFRTTEKTVREYLRILLSALDDTELESLVSSFEKMSIASREAALTRTA